MTWLGAEQVSTERGDGVANAIDVAGGHSGDADPAGRHDIDRVFLFELEYLVDRPEAARADPWAGGTPSSVAARMEIDDRRWPAKRQ